MDTFLPTKELTNRLIDAGDLQDVSIREKKENELIYRTMFSNRIFRMLATQSRIYASRGQKEIRIGENGNFTREVIKMLSERIPIMRGSEVKLYSDLYAELREHVKNGSYIEEWGRVVRDEKGLLVHINDSGRETYSENEGSRSRLVRI